MFSLIRFIFSLLVFAIVIWFVTNVPLGTRTLWGHLKAISGTKEAQELAEGTKQEAKKVAAKLLDGHDGGVPHEERPLDQMDEHDRKKLDELTRPKRQKR